MTDLRMSCSAVALIIALGGTTAGHAADAGPMAPNDAAYTVAQADDGAGDVDFSFDYTAKEGEETVDVALPESDALSEEDRSFFGRFLDRFNSRAGSGARDVSLDKSEDVSGDEISRDRSFDASGDGFDMSADEDEEIVNGEVVEYETGYDITDGDTEEEYEESCDASGCEISFERSGPGFEESYEVRTNAAGEILEEEYEEEFEDEDDFEDEDEDDFEEDDEDDDDDDDDEGDDDGDDDDRDDS